MVAVVVYTAAGDRGECITDGGKQEVGVELVVEDAGVRAVGEAVHGQDPGVMVLLVLLLLLLLLPAATNKETYKFFLNIAKKELLT
jgi:hypothetical protein